MPWGSNPNSNPSLNPSLNPSPSPSPNRNPDLLGVVAPPAPTCGGGVAVGGEARLARGRVRVGARGRARVRVRVRVRGEARQPVAALGFGRLGWG